MSVYAVTGGAGRIGTALVAELLRQGHKVRVLDYVGADLSRVPQGVETSFINIAAPGERGVLKSIFAGCTGVFHLASRTPAQCARDPKGSEHNDVRGTEYVLEAARQARVGRVVLASSSDVYDPCTPYAAHKVACEDLCTRYAGSHGLETVILRFFHVYGLPLDPRGRDRSVIDTFVRQRLNGLPYTIDGDGQQQRSFVYIDDVVRALYLAMATVGLGRAQAMDIGGPMASVGYMAELIHGSDEVLPVDPGLPKPRGQEIVPDLDRAREWMRWNPEVPPRLGIQRMRQQYAF